MTFKQLVDKYSFDDIVPEIKEIWNDGNIYLFRQAHSILKNMTPTSVDGFIEVKHIESERETYNRVSNMSGFYWHENLGWEINVDAECRLSEKQLLALCLWERTFYGFSPEQQLATFEQWDAESISESYSLPDNPYMTQLIEEKRRYYHKRVKRRNRRYDANGLPVWPENEVVGGLKRCKTNRFRKAMQRYKNRCERLERLSEQYELIKDISEKCPEVKGSELQFLLTDREVHAHTFFGLGLTGTEAIDYIVESVRDYSDLEIAADKDECFVLLVYANNEAVPDSADVAKLQNALSVKIGVEPKTIHSRVSNLTEPMRMTVMYK